MTTIIVTLIVVTIIALVVRTIVHKSRDKGRTLKNGGGTGKRDFPVDQP